MSGAKIYTVTLNPSLDRTLVTNYFAVGYQNRVGQPTKLEPAGRGVNISRALHKLDTATSAIVLLGDDATGRAYTSLIAEERIDVTIVTNQGGQTRSNIIIFDAATNTETRIIEDSTEVGSDDIDAIAQLLRQNVAPNDMVILAGSLPDGVADDSYGYLAQLMHDKGAEVVISAAGHPLKEAISAKPDLVVFNDVEAESLYNYPIRTDNDIVSSAKKLIENGVGSVLNNIKSSRRAIMVSATETWVVDLPDEEDGTSSGVWEAMVAGYLTARLKKQPSTEALSLGVAAAAYTAAHIGNAFGTMSEISEYLGTVNVLPYDERSAPQSLSVN
jgi:1-phosphofructokinase